MFEHYLTVALRNFRRAPVATGINVLALALGLTCFVVAYAVVQYWGHAEQGFAKADRTYAITRDMRLKDGSVATGMGPSTTELYAKYLKLDFPEFETVARARNWGNVPYTLGDKQIPFKTAFADPEFLGIFDLPFVSGGGADALGRPASIILTDAAAMRLFGATNVVGRTVVMGTWDLTVTGVIGAIPQPSHLGRTSSASIQFDVLVSWDVLERVEAALNPKPAPGGPPAPESWVGGYCCMTYVVLPEESKLTPRSLKSRFDAFVKRRVPAEQLNMVDFRVGMMPIRNVMAANLNSALFSGKNVGLSVTSLLILFGGLVLLVACVNYANLATAQAIRRAKEVGLRKVLGASRSQVMTQYLLEAMVLTATALALAVAATMAVTPVVKSAVEIDLSLALFSGWAFWAFLVAVIAGVGLLAGAYPAVYLSRVRPILALKAGAARSRTGLAPTLLVGAQFAAASFLLVAVIVMQAQSNELRRSGLGVDRDPMIAITNVSDLTGVNSETLRDAFVRLPQVKAAAVMDSTPWVNNINLAPLRRSTSDPITGLIAYQNRVDYDFFSTMEMPVAAGRVFDRAHGDDKSIADLRNFDSSKPLNIVIDRALSEQIGYRDPAKAIGQIIYMPLTQARLPDQPLRIIGVVENKPLHFVGMGATGNIYFRSDHLFFILVRLDATDVAGGLAAVEGVWKSYVPIGNFLYEFVDKLFAQNYQLFGRVNLVFGGLALFAFVISSIGLFGMATHAANGRRHEIGVRKTLGANTRQIVMMLLRDFSKPVVIANVIAWPLAYLAARAYLNIFIHRIVLSPVPFALSLAITVLIAWVVVGGQTIRAARTKPATVLRYE